MFAAWRDKFCNSLHRPVQSIMPRASLLEDIRADTLDESIPLPSILRKALYLATKIRSEDLKRWVHFELNGYKKEDQLPDYRIIRSASFGTAVNRAWKVSNAPLPTHILPERMAHIVGESHLSRSARELASLLESKENSFKIPWPTFIMQHFNELDCVQVPLIEAWSVIPRGAIENVLDTVRTRLLSFVISTVSGNDRDTNHLISCIYED